MGAAWTVREGGKLQSESRTLRFTLNHKTMMSCMFMASPSSQAIIPDVRAFNFEHSNAFPLKTHLLVHRRGG